MFEVSGHPKRKMEFCELNMGPIMSEMLSLSNIHVKVVNFPDCEIPTAFT